jgi:hypothetical protein
MYMPAPSTPHNSGQHAQTAPFRATPPETSSITRLVAKWTLQKKKRMARPNSIASHLHHTQGNRISKQNQTTVRIYPIQRVRVNSEIQCTPKSVQAPFSSTPTSKDHSPGTRKGKRRLTASTHSTQF